jgi:hypothetical protein
MAYKADAWKELGYHSQALRLPVSIVLAPHHLCQIDEARKGLYMEQTALVSATAIANSGLPFVSDNLVKIGRQETFFWILKEDCLDVGWIVHDLCRTDSIVVKEIHQSVASWKISICGLPVLVSHHTTKELFPHCAVYCDAHSSRYW